MDMYSFNRAPYGTHALIANEIGEQKRVLDIGCNKGYLKLLAAANEYFGIDFDADDLATAKKAGYKEVYELNLNNYQQFSSPVKFDVIVFADVLEHLMHPDKVLSFFSTKFLENGGKIIISLPNVAHLSIRLGLLLGRFDYTENGILDRTHLHLYTKKSARELIEGATLRITKVKYSSNNFGGMLRHFPWFGGLLGFNLIYVCQKK